MTDILSYVLSAFSLLSLWLMGNKSIYGAIVGIVNQAGVYSNQIRTYVLIGYKDTPGDARYRLEKIRSLGALPNPMRYQPLDSVKKNAYIGPAWTDALLKRYMRYWSNLKITGAVPFDEYKRRENLPYYDPNQTTLFKEMEPTHD